MNDQQIIENLTEKLEEAQAEILKLKQRPSIEGMIDIIEGILSQDNAKEDILALMFLSRTKKFAKEYLKKMGAYTPARELDLVKQELEYLRTMQAEAVEVIVDLIEYRGILTSGNESVVRAKKLLSMLEHGIGPEDMKGGNREDVKSISKSSKGAR